MQSRFNVWQQLITRPRNIRKRYLGTGIFLSILILLLYYIGDGIKIGATGSLATFLQGGAYHELVLLLFSGVIVYIAFFLRIIFSLCFSLVGFFVILPHALLIPAYPDPIYRILSWLTINILLALVVGITINARERQKIYLRDIVNTQEQERHRLSRELHDDTAQELIDVGHDIDEILETPGGLPEEVKLNLLNLRKSIDEILEKTRRAIQGLQPPLLEEVGIKPALLWLCGSLAEETGIEVEPDIDFPEDSLTQETKIVLFRVTQEALNNIKKHSQAEKVEVVLVITEDKVRLTIKDDGAGFNPVGRGKLLSRGNFGLAGLQERVELINGSFNLRSKPGEGTMIKVEIPLSNTVV
jgi:signal transduction histidine kinase